MSEASTDLTEDRIFWQSRNSDLNPNSSNGANSGGGGSDLDWLLPLALLLSAALALAAAGACAAAWLGYKRTRRRIRRRRDSRKRAKRIVNEEKGFAAYFVTCAWCATNGTNVREEEEEEYNVEAPLEFYDDVGLVFEKRVTVVVCPLEPIEEVSEVTSAC